MKHFKDPKTGAVFAYEDGVDQKYIRPGLVLMTDAELDSIREQNEQEKRIAQIQAALADIDARTIRPLRAGEMDRVAELEAQAKALRDELNDIKP